MDELERLSEGARSVGSPDPASVARARERLSRAIATENAARSRRNLRPALLIAALALAVPGGLAVADALQEESEISGAPSVLAADCPEATSAFRDTGITPPREYAFECPTPERVQEIIRAVQQDTAIREEFEQSGQLND